MISGKTLKKTFLTALASGLFFSASAQQAYIKVGAGYNFGIASDIVYNSTTTTTLGNNGSTREITSYERVNMNNGKGLPVNATIGYQFNKHIGAELAVGYLLGGKNTIQDMEWFSGNNLYQGGSSMTTIDSYSRMVLVQPSVVFSGGLDGRLNPYTRFGMVLAAGSLHLESNYSDTDGNSEMLHQKLNGGVGLGLQAALGTDIDLNGKASLFTELTFNNLSYAPTKGEITQYIVNGSDRLPNLKPSQTQAEFLDNYTEDTANQPISSLPSPLPKSRYAMSTLGLQAGVKFSF